jgi:hypothetical protein
MEEAKGTLCGRCGHVHVKGTPCPRPFIKEGEELTEAYVPSNIKKFAKEKGVSSLVNKVAGWAEQVGKGIRGGTAVGKNYSTLVLDLDYKQQGEVRIDTDDETITLFDEPIRSFNEFQRVYADGAGNNLEEARENDIVASVDPKHPLATKDIEDWTAEDQKEYKKLWDKKHGNDNIKDRLKKAVTTKLKEAGPMSPEYKKATDLEIQAQQARIKAAQHKIQNLQKGDETVSEIKRPIREGREYDYEGQMARTQLISIIKNAKALFDSIDNNTQLQSWVQSKLTKAEDYIEAVRTYLEGESLTSTTPVVVAENGLQDEEGVTLNVGDVVKAGDGGIYQIIFSYGEGKPFLVPFDLKKRKPVNLRNRTYFESDSMLTKKLHKIMPFSATKGGFMK